MKRGQLLTITSLVSSLLMSFHLSDDVVRGMEPGGLKNIAGIVILVVWLVGALVVRERLVGIVILFLGALLGSGVPVLHMMGLGLVGGEIADSGGVFFWVWTNIALGVTSVFGFIPNSAIEQQNSFSPRIIAEKRRFSSCFIRVIRVIRGYWL